MNKNNNKEIIKADVVIIGGGAAGMMAGAISSSLGAKVLILDKNKFFGEKLKITGGGRCNITNAKYDLHDFISRYGDASKYLFSAFTQFGVKDTFVFFEKRSLPLKVEAGDRAFPITDKAEDVYLALYNELKKFNVKLKNNSQIKGMTVENNLIKNVFTNNEIYEADSFILATGGMSHPETGSTGDGFKWLKSFGHKVISPSPSIVPLATEHVYRSLQGTTLADVKLTFKVDGKKSFVKNGNILFTHFGISGPTILNSSAKVSELLREGNVTLHVDVFPNLDEKAMRYKLVDLFDLNKNKNIKNVLAEIIPGGLVDVILTSTNIPADTKVHVVTIEMRRQIILELKNFTLTIKSLMGLDKAVISDGGISLDEVDTKTMQSKLIKNLFVVGDLLNVSRPSGGYSLQLCWTTGFIAGKNAAKR